MANWESATVPAPAESGERSCDYTSFREWIESRVKWVCKCANCEPIRLELENERKSSEFLAKEMARAYKAESEALAEAAYLTDENRALRRRIEMIEAASSVRDDRDTIPAGRPAA
jgi:hypothetical protein